MSPEDNNAAFSWKVKSSPEMLFLKTILWLAPNFRWCLNCKEVPYKTCCTALTTLFMLHTLQPQH